MKRRAWTTRIAVAAYFATAAFGLYIILTNQNGI